VAASAGSPADSPIAWRNELSPPEVKIRSTPGVSATAASAISAEWDSATMNLAPLSPRM
jgi:hypothetical protein